MTKAEQQAKADYAEKLRQSFPKQDFGITERQDRMLALIASSDGREISPSQLLSGMPGLKASDRDDDIKALLKCGLIERSRYFWTQAYTLKDRYFFLAALNALLYFPDTVEKGRRARLAGNSSRLHIVWKLAEGDDVTSSVSEYLRWNQSAAASFPEIVGLSVFDPVFRALPQAYVALAVSYRLENLIADNSINSEELELLGDFVRRHLKDKMQALLLAEVEGVRFLFCGKSNPVPDIADQISEWPGAVAAISALYAGDYGKAAELMDKALKVHNKTSGMKNVFSSSLLTYFLIVSYLLSDDVKSRKKLDQYLKKCQQNRDLPHLQPAAFLLASLSDGVSERIAEQKIADAASNDDLTARALAAGIARSRNFRVSFQPPMSKLAIVRHETGDCTGEAKAGLEILYGGPSLLSRLRAKQPWEIALEKLSGLLDNGGSAQSSASWTAGKDRRILYLVINDERLEIREQNRLRNGSWGQGKRVSVSSFCTGMYNDISDDSDLKVQTRIANDRYSDISIGALFPALVGCDRVYRESYIPAAKIEIGEELPYIDVKLKKGGYEFSTNVPLSRYQRECNLENVVRRDKLRYAVIRLNKIQAQLLLRLKEVGVKFPEESTAALKDFIGKLSRIIEIHSPLLENGSSLEEKQGNAMLYLRIIPKSGMFNALLYSRPLENGKLTFFPGEGEAVYYDSDDSGRCQVKRDLRAERAALKTFLAGTGLDAFESDEGMYNLAPEDMLPVVDACRGLQDICVLEWPEGRSLNVLGKLTAQSIKINLRSKEQWFEIEGDVQLPDGQSLSLEQIMAALGSGGYGGGYLRLGESDYLSLSDSLAKYLKRLEAITQSGRGGERVSLFQTGALADIVRKSNLDVNTDEAYRDRLVRIDEAVTLNPQVPSALKAELRDYQEEGFRWMARLDHWGAGACLADDMGLGKTVQTIAFLLYKAAKGPSLVVAPASVLMNWNRELARFAPSLNAVILNEQDDRLDALSGVGEYDVVLTTYGLLVREKEALTSREWNVVCLDEAHTIKNRGTKMSDAAMAIKAGSRVILTGTPVQNYLGELWNLFQFLNPGLLGSYESFRQKFIAPIEEAEDKDRQAQLKRIIQPFMLRRTKSEVVEELPEKTEIYRAVPMSAAESVAYETMRLEAKNELEQDTKVNMNALAAITKLREAACAMPLVKTGWAETPTKLSALRELVGEITAGGNSVLVFSQFTGFLDLVSSALEKDGIPHFYLQGSTPIKKRQEMVTAFQRAEKPVFLISLKAGGLGLNLTGANYVIHLDPWWNPAIEQQATDRAYRIGQQQNVTVYHLIAQNSIEEKILRLHKTKQNLADAILEGTSVSHAITLDELRELIR